MTEVLKNNLNPDFDSNITLTYVFERMQKLKFEVIDNNGSGEEGNPVEGEFETNLGRIMGATNQSV